MTRAARPVPLGLAFLVSLVAALVALSLSAGHAHAHGDEHATPAAKTASTSAVALEQSMQRLWLEHVAWTRLAIVSFTSGLPDLEPTLARLLRNQRDLGNAIKPYYGGAAGTALTGLLREHILVAVDVLKAAKAGDAKALAAAQADWTANADEIAGFLARANPDNWPAPAMRSMMRSHLALTTKEAVARLQGKWALDVRTADAVFRQIRHMATMLTNGIVAQFPERFS
jgi:hypothetical protein